MDVLENQHFFYFLFLVFRLWMKSQTLIIDHSAYHLTVVPEALGLALLYLGLPAPVERIRAFGWIIKLAQIFEIRMVNGLLHRDPLVRVESQ